jgi:hypothetical protein
LFPSIAHAVLRGRIIAARLVQPPKLRPSTASQAAPADDQDAQRR